MDALNAEQGTTKRLSETARERIRNHAWRGNVRELRNALQRAFIMSDSKVQIPNSPRRRPGHPAPDAGGSLEESERLLIPATLEKCAGDKKKAAHLLGISLKTLYNRLHAYADI